MTSTIDQQLKKLMSFRDHSVAQMTTLHSRYEEKLKEINEFFDRLIGEIELRKVELQIELSTLYETETTSAQKCENNLMQLHRTGQSLLRECRSFDPSYQQRTDVIEAQEKSNKARDEKPSKKMKKQEIIEEIEKIVGVSWKNGWILEI